MTFFTEDPDLEIGVALTQASRYKPTKGQVFSAAFHEGLDLTSLSAAGRLINFKSPGDSPVLTNDQYKASPDYREGVKYFDTMTEHHASILAERFDKRKEKEFILSRTSGVGDFLVGLTGGLIGSIPDPVNFIPIVGMGSKVAKLGQYARLAQKMSRRGKMATLKRIKDTRKIAGLKVPRKQLSLGGRVLRSSGEAVGGTALSIPLILKTEQLEQGDFDMRMAVQTLAFAAVVGAGFGTLSHAFSKLSPVDNIKATSQAGKQNQEGKPINVESSIGHKFDKADIRDLIKRHVSGEDISTEPVIHAKLKKAEELVSQTRPDGINGTDIIKALNSIGRTQTELDKLILEAIDDSPTVMEILTLFNKDKRTLKAHEKDMLDSFKISTEDEFNSSRIVQQEERISVLEKEVESPDTIAKVEQLRAEVEDLKARQIQLKSGKPEMDFSTGVERQIPPERDVRLDKDIGDIEEIKVFEGRKEEALEMFDERLQAGELLPGAEKRLAEANLESALKIKNSGFVSSVADCIIRG